jgi:hypothetical protein
MHPESMKHKASLWEGTFESSAHITDVHWEGDITPEELMDVADQISSKWQTIDLALDEAHPCHGQTFRLEKQIPDLAEVASTVQRIEAETELAGRFVWVHCCQRVFGASGESRDASGRSYRAVFHTFMFCTEFVSFDDIAVQCNEQFGRDAWDEYELYLDDDLPAPVASYG